MAAHTQECYGRVWTLRDDRPRQPFRWLTRETKILEVWWDGQWEAIRTTTGWSIGECFKRGLKKHRVYDTLELACVATFGLPIQVWGATWYPSMPFGDPLRWRNHISRYHAPGFPVLEHNPAGWMAHSIHRVYPTPEAALLEYYRFCYEDKHWRFQILMNGLLYSRCRLQEVERLALRYPRRRSDFTRRPGWCIEGA